MKKPLLTVCLLTYNHAQYVREAVDSILEQETDFAWQLVIADDHSTDGTQDILKEYQKKYPERIALILQKKNKGPEANWLDLISFPKTKYVLYAEGDDYFIDSSKLQRQVDFLESHKDYSLCFHPVRVVYEGMSKKDEVFPTPQARFNKRSLRFDDLLQTNFIQTNSVMYRWRYATENIKDTYPKGIIPGDWYLHLLHAQTGKIGFIDRVMTVYRRHSLGLWWESDKNLDAIWKKHGSGHMQLYAEMMKLSGDRASQKNVIAAKIQKLFHDLHAVDIKEGTQLVDAAVLRAPDAAKVFMVYEMDLLTDTVKQNEAISHELATLRRVTTEQDEQLRRYEYELQRIKHSRVWVMRNKIAKLLNKEVIQ